MKSSPQAFPAGSPAVAETASVMPPPAPDGTEICTCFHLRSAARRASALYARHLQPIGLGLPQFSLIGMAAAFEKRNGRPASIAELARALDLDRTTLTRNLRPLLAAALVTVEPAGRGFGQGGRAKAVRATREGRMAYRAGLPLWRAAQDELRRALGPQHKALMDSLHAAIGAMPPAGTGGDDGLSSAS